jgi:rubrerythrin
MSPRTKQNLNAAMQNEAFTHAEYIRFAAHARLRECWALANLFQTAADSDRLEHFADEAELARLVASDLENLKHALVEKRAEVAMYARFVSEAQADGDLAAAALFERIRAEEASQAEAFEIALPMETRECSSRLVEV